MELRNAINDRFAISVPATLAFDRPNLASLVEFVAEAQPRAPAAAATLRALGTADADVLAVIMSAVRGVLGSAISPDQPLLEVS